MLYSWSFLMKLMLPLVTKTTRKLQHILQEWISLMLKKHLKATLLHAFPPSYKSAPVEVRELGGCKHCLGPQYSPTWSCSFRSPILDLRAARLMASVIYCSFQAIWLCPSSLLLLMLLSILKEFSHTFLKDLPGTMTHPGNLNTQKAKSRRRLSAED